MPLAALLDALLPHDCPIELIVRAVGTINAAIGSMAGRSRMSPLALPLTEGALAG